MQHPAPPLARLASAVLTDDPRLRLSLSVTLVSLLTYLLYGGIGAVQVAWGTMELRWLVVCGVAAIVVNAGFYVAIRSGRTRHLDDPAIGPLQLCTGVLFAYATYATSGPAANASLIILGSHVGYAMFAFAVRQLWRFVIIELAGLAIVMLCMHRLDPANYPVHLQWIGFLYACLVMPLIASLARRLARLNQRLQSQRSELRAALERVQQMAIRDELTQSFNRRHMTDLIALQRSHHVRSALPLAVSLLDLDHFKQINDRLGHAVGDRVLRRFADTATRQLRAGDLLSRWGGEEFLVLFPATRSVDACAALQRLREALAAEDFSDLCPSLRVTFSAGVTMIQSAESDAAAIERADRAMYSAKDDGRNRTVVH
ncbi:MAG TPA: GGDEF domain-containing protein [Burkholderiaceae bacterium]